MGFTVRYECGGRLGNCVFPYLLCILYSHMYGHTYVNDRQPNEVMITDKEYLQHFSTKGPEVVLPNIQANLVFNGYFQHDVYLKYLKQILVDFIQKHPQQLLITGWKEHIPAEILTKDYLPEIVLTEEDIVIHLRLEDKLTDLIEENSAHFVIHPDDYERILSTLKYNQIYWVMNKPKEDLEHKYIAYLQKRWGGIFQARTLEEDMCLMRKAKTLVCSRSTLSWVCSGFSEGVQVVYMPEAYEHWSHETFHDVHPQTFYYSYRKATKQDLLALFTANGL
jgi:hypothetical protein